MAALPAQARIIHPAPSIPTTGLTTRPADFTITRSRGNDIMHDAVFTPDGNHIVIWSDASAINVWELLIQYWPEITAVFLSLLSLWTIKRLITRIHGGQTPGLAYCRRCQYCLENCPSSRCPECGAAVARFSYVAPPLKRVLRLRILLILALLTVAIVLPQFPVPRFGRISNFFRWDSVSLATWADAHRVHFLRRHKIPVTTIDEFDCSTQQQIRRICVLRDYGADQDPAALMLREMRVWRTHRFIFSQDGAFVGMQHDDELDILNLANGQVTRRHCPPKFYPISVAAGGTTVFGHATATSVQAWDLRNNQRHFIPLTFERLCRLNLNNESGQLIREIVTDGTTIRVDFAPATDASDHKPSFTYSARFVAVGPDHRYAYITADEAIRVKDLRTDQWIARLAAAPGYHDDCPRVSPSGQNVLLIGDDGQTLTFHRNVLPDSPQPHTPAD